jgi:hypothetical protein
MNSVFLQEVATAVTADKEVDVADEEVEEEVNVVQINKTEAGSLAKASNTMPTIGPSSGKVRKV